MRLEGLHHITAITADARRNLAFYTGVLGLRLVKKTVNQDDPTAARTGGRSPALAHLRVQLERVLTPLPNVRPARRVS